MLTTFEVEREIASISRANLSSHDRAKRLFRISRTLRSQSRRLIAERKNLDCDADPEGARTLDRLITTTAELLETARLSAMDALRQREAVLA